MVLSGGSFLYMGDGGRSGAYSGETGKPSPSPPAFDRARNIDFRTGRQSKIARHRSLQR